MDTTNLKERNYRQVMFIRQQNLREERLLENVMNSKHGVKAIHKYHMVQVENEENNIKKDLMKLRNTMTTTWGFLPPRLGQKPSAEHQLHVDPFEKLFAAEKQFKDSKPKKTGFRQSLVKGTGNENKNERGGMKTAMSCPSKLEHIGKIDLPSARQNVFNRLARPKQFLDPKELGKLPPSEKTKEKVKEQKRDSRKNGKGNWSVELGEVVEDIPGVQFISTSIVNQQTSTDLQRTSSNSLAVNLQQHSIRSESAQDTVELTTETGTMRENIGSSQDNNKRNSKVSTNESALPIGNQENKGSSEDNNKRNFNVPTTISVSSRVTGNQENKGASQDNIKRNSKVSTTVSASSTGNQEKKASTEDSSERNPRALLTPIKEVTRGSDLLLKKKSFVRSSTKASSFIKTSNKKKTSKGDNSEKKEVTKYNPDGSLRTVYTLPDFQESVNDAMNAGYLRSKYKVWYEREISVSDIWKDKGQGLQQKLRLK